MVPRDPLSVLPRDDGPFGRRTLAVVGLGLLAVSVAAVTAIAVVLTSSTACACADPPPRFTFSENASGDARTVTITVASGRGSYDRDDLAVAVGGNATGWTALPGARTNGSTDLTPGESVSVDGVTAGDEVEIYWRPESADGSHVVANYTVASEVGGGDGDRNVSSADSRRRPAPPRR